MTNAYTFIALLLGWWAIFVIHFVIFFFFEGGMQIRIQQLLRSARKSKYISSKQKPVRLYGMFFPL